MMIAMRNHPVTITLSSTKVSTKAFMTTVRQPWLSTSATYDSSWYVCWYFVPDLLACLQVLPAHGGVASNANNIHQSVQPRREVLMARGACLLQILLFLVAEKAGSCAPMYPSQIIRPQLATSRLCSKAPTQLALSTRYQEAQHKRFESQSKIGCAT